MDFVRKLGKIQKIKGEGRVVYREDEVKNIRELRNEIVHRGSIPDSSQAENCRAIAKDFLAHA